MIYLRNDEKVMVYLVPQHERGHSVELGDDVQVEWTSSDEKVATVQAQERPQAEDPANSRSQAVKKREQQHRALVLSGDEPGHCQILAKVTVEGETMNASIDVEVVQAKAKAKQVSIEAGPVESAIEQQPAVTPGPGGPVHFDEPQQRPEPRKEELAPAT